LGPVNTAGQYFFQASYSGDTNNNAVTTTCGVAGETATVTPVTPAIVTTATTAALGGNISDSAVLSGGFNPGGTITFRAFTTAGCTGPAAFTSAAVIVNGDGTYVSGPLGPVNAAASYFFVASYTGDTNNNAVTTACGALGETATVSPSTPAITTTASGTVALGGTISDSAILSGGFNPTGTITFTVFGPNNSSCTGAPAFPAKTVTAAGDGTYASGTFTPTAPGTYRFVVTYSGDTNNAAATSACGAAGESVVVGQVTPAITTTASGPVAVGGSISDTGVLSGGVAPTGTVTFAAFLSAGCTGVPVFTSAAIPVSGNGTYHSGNLGPVTVAGSYQFVVTYSGDANNASVVSACGASGETAVVVAPVIAVTKAAAPPSLPAPGGTFTFTVQVSNPSTSDPIIIKTLVDNIYGDLFTRAGSTCGVLKDTTLAPGASSPTCSFPGVFMGSAGASQTDTVTVTGVDVNGLPASAMAMATVTLTPPPLIALTKTASPASLPVPGGTFTFTTQVSNPSTTTPVTITKLVDNVYGDLATRAGSTCGALIGTVLAPGGKSAPCSFPGSFTGAAGASQTDTITVTGMSNGATVTATAQATVTLTPVSKPNALVSPITLHVPAACVTKPFKVYVTGASIAGVVYYLDGKRIATVSKRDSAGHFSVTVRPAALTKGKTHHLTAVVKPVAHAGQPVRTVRRTFAVCGAPTVPRFTG
jgi:hypothetical protein